MKTTQDTDGAVLAPGELAKPEYTAEVYGSVWMSSIERNESVARMVAIDAMGALGIDPGDAETRNRIVSAIHRRINGTLDYVSRPLGTWQGCGE